MGLTRNSKSLENFQRKIKREGIYKRIRKRFFWAPPHTLKNIFSWIPALSLVFSSRRRFSMQLENHSVLKQPALRENMFNRPGVANPSQEGYYNSINPLVEGVPTCSQASIWGAPHIHRPWKFIGLRREPHLFPCNSIHWTTVFCIEVSLQKMLRP